MFALNVETPEGSFAPPNAGSTQVELLGVSRGAMVDLRSTPLLPLERTHKAGHAVTPK